MSNITKNAKNSRESDTVKLTKDIIEQQKNVSEETLSTGENLYNDLIWSKHYCKYRCVKLNAFAEVVINRDWQVGWASEMPSAEPRNPLKPGHSVHS
jgi:hypothetical protein